MLISRVSVAADRTHVVDELALNALIGARNAKLTESYAATFQLSTSLAILEYNISIQIKLTHQKWIKVVFSLSIYVFVLKLIVYSRGHNLMRIAVN